MGLSKQVGSLCVLRHSRSIPPGLSGGAPPATAALGARVPTPKAVGRGESRAAEVAL